MEEGANGLLSVDLVLVLGNDRVFWRVFVEESLPLLLVALDLVNDVLEEARWLIVKLMLR